MIATTTVITMDVDDEEVAEEASVRPLPAPLVVVVGLAVDVGCAVVVSLGWVVIRRPVEGCLVVGGRIAVVSGLLVGGSVGAAVVVVGGAAVSGASSRT